MQFPMTKDADVLRAAQERCFAEVRARMQQGKTLVFLTIGDQVYTRRTIIFTGVCLQQACPHL